MWMLSQTADSPRASRRWRAFAVAVVAALTASGAAFAWHGLTSASPVTATFYANTVSNSQSQTCTAANNDSIQLTEATFTGTASSSDSHLNGPITIDARSVYDATTNAGSVMGDVQIGSGGSPATFEGRLVTVNVNGHLQGMLIGEESGAGGLLGNLTATFSTTGGFSSQSSPATIGTGTGTDTAIVGTSSCGSHEEDSDQDDNGQNNQDQDNHGGLEHFGHNGQD